MQGMILFSLLLFTNLKKKRFLTLRIRCHNTCIIEIILYQYYICPKSSSQFIEFHIKMSTNHLGNIKFYCYCVRYDYTQ